MPTIYDDSNYKLLMPNRREERLPGTGEDTVGVTVVGGQRRYLSWKPTLTGRIAKSAAPFLRSSFPTIPRNEWPDRIKEKAFNAKRSCVSHYQSFAPHDQNGLPTCWANGPSHAYTTQHVIQFGIKRLVYISACSLAVPISGGHVGGDEWDAGQYLQKYGGASQQVWSNNDTTRSLDTSPAVVESRKHNIALQLYQLEGFDEFATACLLSMPVAIAFNWWSHVISGGDLVQIEAGSYGIMYRNNWGSWGDNNELGQPGYVTMREGKGTPDSGFAFGTILASAV